MTLREQYLTQQGGVQPGQSHGAPALQGSRVTWQPGMLWGEGMLVSGPGEV